MGARPGRCGKGVPARRRKHPLPWGREFQPRLPRCPSARDFALGASVASVVKGDSVGTSAVGR